MGRWKSAAKEITLQRSTRGKLECAEQRWHSSWLRGIGGCALQREAQQRPFIQREQLVYSVLSVA